MHLQSKGQMPGATTVAQLVQALAPKPEELSLILRSHVVARVDSSDLHTSAVDTHACAHTQAHKYSVNAIWAGITRQCT